MSAAIPICSPGSTSNAEELSLCFDPDSDLVGEDGDGPALFDGDKPSEALSAILKFCEDFEIAAQRTNAFVKELQEMDLLIDGEVTIQPEGAAQPFIYRGFRMVDEEKLRDMPGDQLAQDQPERHPAADHGPSLLAVVDPRPVRAPGGSRARCPSSSPSWPPRGHRLEALPPSRTRY